MQHVEQLDEERHVFARAAFDQRQDELTLFEAYEEIAVFGAGGNALEVE